MKTVLPARFLIALAALGVVLTVTVVPGVFIVDDNNYLINVVALRQGRVTVANTEGLTPSRELLFFDPGPMYRHVNSTPVASTAPPLYAPLALPFSWFGVRGLVALNTLSYLVAVALVFSYTRRYATNDSTPWLAAGALALGSYTIEYAQGIWPQMLSLVLCLGSVIAAGRVLDGAGVRLAAVSGLLIGVATGVRYQNFVLLGALGVGVFFWSQRRWTTSIAFAAAAAVPLGFCSLINHARLDSWNPISKGPGYLALSLVRTPEVSFLDHIWAFWARLVDFTYWPPMTGPSYEGWLTYSAGTGAHLIFGITAKKAILQSAPWAVLAILLFALAWLPRFAGGARQKRQAQLLSLVVVAAIGTFAFFGVRRDDGLAFNQRYFLEVMPLFAIGFAWAIDMIRLQVKPLVVGAVFGFLLVGLILIGTPPTIDSLAGWELRQWAVLKTPLVLLTAVAIAWLMARRREALQPLTLSLVGLCLGWALTLHVGDDVLMSRMLKNINAKKSAELSQRLPAQSALVAYWSAKDAAGPLLLDRDVVILDARADAGEDAQKLIGELQRQGRRTFLLSTGFPQEVLERVTRGMRQEHVEYAGSGLVELKFP